ncbi:unnamed protein product [Mytilus coruscus]|uniref:Uncharacterized protein n=1 Tax=Mytilus coruscus TaxID=42192 RepID=A0A6J8DGL6_MYTCO|nr:unnamed protein product [Mytilus coruscus]
MNFIRELHEYRSQKELDAGGTVPLALVSTVNGYHFYHRRPLDGICFMMNCAPEPSNRHDRNAVVVRAPTNVDANILGIETHIPPRRHTVMEVLGQIIGHVPRNICGIISISMLHRRTLRSAYIEAIDAERMKNQREKHCSIKNSDIYNLNSMHIPDFSSVPRAKVFDDVLTKRNVADSEDLKKLFQSNIAFFCSKDAFSVCIRALDAASANALTVQSTKMSINLLTAF